MFPMPRKDVSDALIQQFPAIGESCGFILFVPNDSSERECRALRFELDNGCVEWLQLQANESIRTGHQLLRALSVSLADVSKLESTIFDFFDSGFGATIERLSAAPRQDAAAHARRQFGQPPAGAERFRRCPAVWPMRFPSASACTLRRRHRLRAGRPDLCR